jgi:hypothetical protein
MVLACCGCGPGSGVVGSGRGSHGSTSGTPGSGSQSTSATATTATTATSTTGTSGTTAATTGGPSCEGFDDDLDLGPQVTVTVRNEGTEPLYLRTYSCSNSVLEVLDPGGEPVEWRIDPWLPPCSDILEDESCSPPGSSCIWAVLQMDPGGQVEETFAGFALEYARLPDGCALNNGEFCGPGCVIRREPEPGEWTFQVNVATQIDCMQASCECTEPPVNGTCPITDADDIGLPDIHPVGFTVPYPGTSNLEIVLP